MGPPRRRPPVLRRSPSPAARHRRWSANCPASPADESLRLAGHGHLLAGNCLPTPRGGCGCRSSLGSLVAAAGASPAVSAVPALVGGGPPPVDDLAYGVGVWKGMLAERTWPAAARLRPGRSGRRVGPGGDAGGGPVRSDPAPHRRHGQRGTPTSSDVAAPPSPVRRTRRSSRSSRATGTASGVALPRSPTTSGEPRRARQPGDHRRRYRTRARRPPGVRHRSSSRRPASAPTRCAAGKPIVTVAPPTSRPRRLARAMSSSSWPRRCAGSARPEELTSSTARSAGAVIVGYSIHLPLAGRTPTTSRGRRRWLGVGRADDDAVCG